MCSRKLSGNILRNRLNKSLPMKKIICFFVLLSGVLCGFAQTKTALVHNPGIYTTFEIRENEPIKAMPQAWVYLNKFYFEARYNYDDSHSFSLYFGRAFSLSKKATAEMTPMIGGVVGRSKGISPALNFYFEYLKFSSTTQSQYTIIMPDGNSSYFYDWTNFSFNLNKKLGMGGSIQITIPQTGSSVVSYGPLLNFRFKNFLLEGYAYNFWKVERLWAVAVQYAIK
jgi:hypothetical protein